MDRRRAAAALFVLAACFACSSAAPTASNPTALDIHDGPAEGCYYNFQHYGEGDRIMTNEPCLNCTCHNKMLMCYLRVCPFTKAIGQDCTVEKRADQCCPIVTCPDVPVDLLTSTSTSSPAEYGPTGVGRLDKYGCSINNKYFPEGSKVPSSPNKPCEHCYCIRNMTTCVMQECTLHVDGCTPIYHKDVCCPVRYSCDHPEDEIPLLDDMTTTVRPTQGFLLTTTTMMPVTQMTQDCIHDEQIFPDGASIKTDKACEHCYCMKGDIVCVVQECGTPMENEGKNCTSLPPRQGQCCPDTYICEGDEPSLELTTENIESTPPRRHGVEGSGYRNEPDEPFTEKSPFEHDIEGSGEISETEIPTKVSPEITDELLLVTTEKEVLSSQATEANKDLNTITDNILEKEPSVTYEEDSFTQSTESILVASTESKATMGDEVITSGDVTSNEGEEISQTEIPKEKDASLPEQSTLRDEYPVTESSILIQKEPEIILGSTDNVVPYDISTTEASIIPSITEKDYSIDEKPEINKIENGSEITNSDISVTDQTQPDVGSSTLKEMNIVDDVITVSNKEVAETTSVNPVDNEVDYIPGRIPGEGDCLLNGITYSNYSSVPSTNNCHTGCKCISSIIKCDPIICSPPPEYMENMNDCQTSYDTPDACCPTYICSAKETSLPQSHSQTSVTESSKPVVLEECKGNDCNLDEVKQPSSEPHKICDSGNCENGSKQNDCGVNGCQGEEQTPSERPISCSGDECSVSPIVSCDGENCGEPAPTEEKDISDQTHSESPSKPICNDPNGCDNIKDTSPTDDECNDETCRRKDIFETQTNVHAECSGTECKIDDDHKRPLIEPTIAPVTEYVINEKETERIPDELDVPKTASPVPNTPDKTMTIEPISDIGTETATDKVQSPIETLPDLITSEEPTRPQEDISKSETSPTELNVMSDIVTEKSKTSDETSIDQGSYTSSSGLSESEAVTESGVDIISVNKDTPSEGYTKDVSQTTTLKSEIHPDVYETNPDESITKSPMLKDDEKEIPSMEIPNIPSNEGKITAESEDYPMTTEKLEAMSVSDEKIDTTKIQENVNIELPDSTMEIGSGAEDHSELIPTQSQDLPTEILQDDKTEDNNKFTTVKSITLPGVTENQTPDKIETQSILSETVSSESYTELPQTVGTKSDVADDSGPYTTGKSDESDNIFMESTPSSGGKHPEESSTKLDEMISEDGHSETETVNQEYATTERKPSILNDDDLNVEKQTTISQMKNTDENEIEQDIQTKQPKVDKITERTELELTTVSHRETEMEDFVEKDSQTISPLDNKVTGLDLVKDITVTESAHPYTLNEITQPASELSSQDQHLDSLTSTAPQDISATKDSSTAAVLRDESDIQITSATDKNLIEMTPPSDESATESKYVSDVAKGDEFTTQLPKEEIEQDYPTKDFKLSTVLQDTGISVESTTSVIISEEKPQSPDLQVPEKAIEENEIIEDVTTALPNENINEDTSSPRLPEIISQSEDATGIPSDEEKLTTSSIYKTKEEEKTESNLEEISHITISDVPISESVTEKVNMPSQEYPKQESSAEESSEEPEIIDDSTITNDLTTESPHSQTGPSDKYEIDQKPKLPSSEINDVTMSTSIPLLNQDDEMITEKILTPDTSEIESTSKKSEYDIIPDKNKPSVAMSTESNIDNDMFPNSVTENNNIEVVELSTPSQTKATETLPTAYESDTQNTGIQQENEKPSAEVPKQTTEGQFENELTPAQEHETVASIPKDQNIDIEDARTTESIPIKQEDIPVHPNMPIESIHTISDESYTTATRLDTDIVDDLMTTEVVPVKHEELPEHQEPSPVATSLPELDISEGDAISKIDSDTLTTESLITSKPSLISPTEESKTDSTKLTDLVEEQPLPSIIPVVDSTSQTEPESVTEQEDNVPYTTEKQYVSKSDQEDIPEMPQLPEEQVTVQTDIENVNKQDILGAFTTEKQYVTKSEQEDVPKLPVLVDGQSSSQSDIESVTKLEESEPFTTEKQYVTKSEQEDIPKIPVLVDEQSSSQNDIESVTKLEESEPFTTEKQYVTKSEQEDIPKIPLIDDEQSSSQSDIESVTKLEESEPFTTEKQYVTKSEQEDIPKIPVIDDAQSSSQSDIESVTKLEESEPFTTEKQYVTKSEQEDIPKIPVLVDEQSSSQNDIESVTKLEESEPFTTEKQYVTKSEQEDNSKIPVIDDEQSSSQSDIESVTKLEDSEPYTTEKQYVTISEQEDIPKIPVIDDVQSSSQSDIESVTKLEESEPFTTEKQYVTKSEQEDIPKIPVIDDAQGSSQSDIESVTKLEESEPFTTEKQYVTKSEQEDIPKIPMLVDEQSSPQSDIESITKFEESEHFTTEKQYVTKFDEVPEIPKLPEEQNIDHTNTEDVSEKEDSQPFTTEQTYVTKLDQDIPKLPEQIEEQSTSHIDAESVTKLQDAEPLVTEKPYVSSDQEEIPKVTVLMDEQSTSQSGSEDITKLDDIEPYTTERQYVTKSDKEDKPKIPEPSEEVSTAQTDSVSKQEDSGSMTTEKQYVTESDQLDITKGPVIVDEQSTSQIDIESVTKLDDTEQQHITISDQEEVPKIPVIVDEENTSQSEIEHVTKHNDIEPYTTEKEYEIKSNEEVPESPELPKEQSTVQPDIELVSKIEDSGSFTTENPYVTVLEQEVPKIPEVIEDLSTPQYDSVSVTKLEDFEPYVTEKQYVSKSDQDETPKLPVLSEEQSTSRIDTESITKVDESGSDHEESYSHKMDADAPKPEQGIEVTEKITTEPLSYSDTPAKPELDDSDLLKPSEEVTVVPLLVSSSIPDKDGTPIKTVTEYLDDSKQYSTERNVQTSVAAEESVTLEAELYESEHKTPSKSSTEEGSNYSETTPYAVLLEEHTHSVQEDTSSNIPIEEGTTVRDEVQPERGDQIPDIPEPSDEYERTTAKQIEDERTTSNVLISSPIIESGEAADTPPSVEKITSDLIKDEDKKYSPSIQDERVTTPIVLPTIEEKEQTTSPAILEKEITTVADIKASSAKPELPSSSSKDDSAHELLPSSTSKIHEEPTTHLPPSEDKYKEKPLSSSPSPSSSEMPDILEEPHEDEHSPDFPPSGGGGGYGQEPDYVEEDQAFGPGTCRYGGKVYVSAQQIPRDDPCDFCFCFRSDIICLQQSCPPPIHGCHEEPIQGFCCPRYECPVSMATTVNVTTTTTTTTTTLPPHFLPHAYKGAAQRRGCQIKGHSYKVGEVVRASSGPCLHCTCGGDGQMKCDPKACTPEPMLRQMIAAAVSAKRRR